VTVLILGIILLVIGAALIVVPDLARLAPLGWLLAIIGVVLVVVALVDVNDANAAVLMMATIPPAGKRLAHASHGAGPTSDQEPVISVATAADSQPVIVAFLVAAVPIVCAFILQVLEATDVLDNALWIRTLLTGLGTLTGALAAVWARSRVTPTAAPRLDDDTPLVPMVESEHV
jgi:hypothetical protein